MVNDSGMMHSFWSLLEQLLNSVLFTLGGVVWGAVISDDSPAFTAKDWGYLFILYALLNVIRFGLVLSFYPVLSNIGLGSKWQEAVFLSFAGLRGAVGIALAISLTEKVAQASGGEYNEYTEDVAHLFGMVGGISFLTLFINGTLCGPLIKKLGLVKSTTTRDRIVEHEFKRARKHLLCEYIHLMSKPRFYSADFAITSHHLKLFKGLTIEELNELVGRQKSLVASKKYRAPYLRYVLPYLTSELDESDDIAQKSKKGSLSNAAGKGKEEVMALTKVDALTEQVDVTASSDATTGPQTIELRLVFIEMLQSAYNKQIQGGELDARSFLVYRLFESLEQTSADVRDGKALNDWENIHILSDTWAIYADIAVHKVQTLNQTKTRPTAQIKSETAVKTAFAFIAAHVSVQGRFKREFVSNSNFGLEGEAVVLESKAEVNKAKKLLGSYDPVEVSRIISMLLTRIILNKDARYLEGLSSDLQLVLNLSLF